MNEAARIARETRAAIVSLSRYGLFLAILPTIRPSCFASALLTKDPTSLAVDFAVTPRDRARSKRPLPRVKPPSQRRIIASGLVCNRQNRRQGLHCPSQMTANDGQVTGSLLKNFRKTNLVAPRKSWELGGRNGGWCQSHWPSATVLRINRY